MKYKQLIPYITVFILISGLCCLVYTAVQQDLRQSANDPQIQMAEDAAVALAKGDQPVFASQTIDLMTSLRPFLAIYNAKGQPVISDAMLSGQLPTPPAGVFATAKNSGEYRVTWQPTLGIRQALVIVAVNNATGQFVAAGRSLRDVEIREQQIMSLAAVAWVLLLLVSFAGIYLSARKKV